MNKCKHPDNAYEPMRYLSDGVYVPFCHKCQTMYPEKKYPTSFEKRLDTEEIVW
jgi:hypothetical protein